MLLQTFHSIEVSFSGSATEAPLLLHSPHQQSRLRDRSEWASYMKRLVTMRFILEPAWQRRLLLLFGLIFSTPGDRESTSWIAISVTGTPS